MPSRRAYVAAGATMVAALALNALWLPSWLVAALAPLALLAVAARWRGVGALPTFWRVLLLVGACAAIAATQPSVFGREAGAALLASMLVLKYMESSSVRDARLVVMVANFLAMAAFLHDQSISQTALTVLLLVLVLIALQWLRIDRVDADSADAMQPSLREWRAPVREALLTLGVAVPFALASFFLFPRLGAPLWGNLDQTPRSRIGIDDELELGSLSGLALDDSPAFRVRFDNDAPAPAPALRYWRGLVLWSFDGRVWRGSRRFAGVPARDEIEAGSPQYSYEVSLVADPRTWRFALDVPLSTPAGLNRSVDLQITGPAGSRSNRVYRATSATQYRLQRSLPPRMRAAALELPAGSNPRAQRLARQWRAAHSGNVDAIVNEALTMVRDQFEYSLDPPPLGANAIDEFLFATRIGFCEHFASSFVFLMRSAGIPARIVTGYQGGYRNAVGKYWIVRQSDAHAWAEIWVEDRGWLRIDPTAAVAPERVQQGGAGFADDRSGVGWLRAGGWWRALGDRADLLGSWWQEAVVGFDSLRQSGLLERLGIRDDEPIRQVLLWISLVLATLGLAALLLSLKRSTPKSDWVVAYRDFAARLEAGGVSRRLHEGPVDFAERAATALPSLKHDIRGISAEFVALRYAPESAADASRDRIAALRRRVRALRVSRPRDGSTS